MNTHLDTFERENKQLVVKLIDFLDILKKKGKLITINNKKYDFKISRNDYFKDQLEYKLYVSYTTSATFRINENSPVSELISRVSKHVEYLVSKINQVDDLKNENFIKEAQARRESALQKFREAKEELDQLKQEFLNEEIYKQLLEVKYLESLTIYNA